MYFILVNQTTSTFHWRRLNIQKGSATTESVSVIVSNGVLPTQDHNLLIVTKWQSGLNCCGYDKWTCWSCKSSIVPYTYEQGMNVNQEQYSNTNSYIGAQAGWVFQLTELRLHAHVRLIQHCSTIAQLQNARIHNNRIDFPFTITGPLCC